MKNKELWDSYIKRIKEKNDRYTLACAKVANKVMELLDADPTPLHYGFYPDIHTAHGLICKACDDVDENISGAMAGFVALMVSECHERGEEFRKSINGEGYQGDGVVNHAMLIIQ